MKKNLSKENTGEQPAILHDEIEKRRNLATDWETLSPEELNEIIQRQESQIKALSDPIRMKICTALAKPCTVTQIAKKLDTDRNSLYYHLKILLKVGLVEEHQQHRVRNFTETVYKYTDVEFYHGDPVIPDPDGSNLAGIKHFTYSQLESIRDDFDRLWAESSPPSIEIKRASFKCNSQKMGTVGKLLFMHMDEFLKKIESLNDENGDAEINLAIVAYESPPD